MDFQILTRKKRFQKLEINWAFLSVGDNLVRKSINNMKTVSPAFKNT
jgi:hypothetical protein